jgi:hypothetical protein
VVACGVGVVITITALVLYFSPRRRAALVRCLRCGAGNKALAKVTSDRDQALDSSTVNPLSATAEEPAVMPSPKLALPTARFKSTVPPAPTGEEPTAPSAAKESRTAPAEPAGKPHQLRKAGGPRSVQ